MISLDGSGRFFEFETKFWTAGFKIELFQTVFAGSKILLCLPVFKGLDTVVKPAQRRIGSRFGTLDITLPDNL
jgi:hypothetical protein